MIAAAEVEHPVESLDICLILCLSSELAADYTLVAKSGLARYGKRHLCLSFFRKHSEISIKIRSIQNLLRK